MNGESPSTRENDHERGSHQPLTGREARSGRLKGMVKTTYLQMFARPDRVVPLPREGLAVVHARKPTVAYYRFLYDAVGRNWQWTSRKRLADADLARIIHDPPSFSLAGDLYSGTFYRQLFRVLKRGGRLFHYIGDPNSKASGGVTRGALRRLQEAGFARVVRRPEAFGVVAYK